MERAELMAKITPIINGLVEKFAQADIDQMIIQFGRTEMYITVSFAKDWMIHGEGDYDYDCVTQTFKYKYHRSYHHLEGTVDHICQEYDRFLASKSNDS